MTTYIPPRSRRQPNYAQKNFVSEATELETGHIPCENLDRNCETNLLRNTQQLMTQSRMSRILSQQVHKNMCNEVDGGERLPEAAYNVQTEGEEEGELMKTEQDGAEDEKAE